MRYEPIPVDDPITIQEAYKELTTSAFALWVRLIVASKEELSSQKNIVKLADFSPAQTTRLLQELRRKGYVISKRNKYPDRHSTLKIRKRALLSGNSGFIKLSNFLKSAISIDCFENFSEKIHDENSNNLKILRLEKKTKKEQYELDFFGSLDLNLNNTVKHFEAKNLLFSETTNVKTLARVSESKRPRKKLVLEKNDLPQNLSGTKTIHGEKNRIVPKSKRKVITEEDLNASTLSEPDNSLMIKKLEEAEEKKNVSLNINLLKDKFLKRKEEEEKIKKLRRKKREVFLRSKHTSTREQINFEKLDLIGEDQISYSPSDIERKELIKILSKQKKNQERKELAKEIGKEFKVIYEKYRNMVIASNSGQIIYGVSSKEEKYTKQAAEECIKKGITPRQLIEYWHEHIKNFADKGLSVPPLTFISSPANIDSASCSFVNKKTKKTSHQDWLDSRNSFANIGKLDQRLRPGLEAAGFDVTNLNDRYLMSIQLPAQDIAEGASVFVSDKIKPLVDWAVKNLYKDSTLEQAS